MTCCTDRFSLCFWPKKTPSTASRKPNGVGGLFTDASWPIWARRLRWSETARDNCFILDTSALPKRGKRLENLSFVYDHSQGKTVKGYEILTLGLLTPRNFYPVNFGHHFSHTAPAQAPEARPLKTRGDCGPAS